MTYEKDPARLTNSLHNLKVLYDAGIPIAMGTDNMLEMMGGEVEHKELAYYVEAGLTPMEAITLATGNAARHLGIEDRKGFVKEGMEADLILLDQDPSQDISNIQFIHQVFCKGKIVYSQNVIQSYDIPEFHYPTSVNQIRLTSTDGKEEKILDVSGYNTSGKIVQRITREGILWSEEICQADRNLSLISWEYTRSSDHTFLKAVKESSFIHMTGTFKGKEQDKRFRIEDGLWYQMMEMALPAFLKSSENEILLYSIGTGNNRGAMSLGEFAAKKLGIEQIIVNGNAYSCYKVSLVLTMFSWAWTGLYWYDIQTGQLIQSGEKKGKTEKILYRIC